MVLMVGWAGTETQTVEASLGRGRRRRFFKCRICVELLGKQIPRVNASHIPDFLEYFLWWISRQTAGCK